MPKNNQNHSSMYRKKKERNRGESSSRGISVAVDAGGNVYTTGSFLETVDFDPGAGVFNLTSTGGEDIFVTKLNSTGNLVWARQFAGGFAIGISVAVDAGGNVYTTGVFSQGRI